ncbi:MAG: hypothetical protein HUJ63_04065 [Enterococcus sp.]|nr:hypothetical protein [Enterococcus sp.]
MEMRDREKFGIRKGIKQGEKRGLKRGIEQGIEQGVARTKKQVAQNMFKKGIDTSVISECVGQPEEKIKSWVK